MSPGYSTRTALGLAVTAAVGILALSAAVAATVSAGASLAINSARITVAGNSNLHPYTASTTAVRLTRVEYGDLVTGDGFWNVITHPGALKAFEVSIPAAKLSSPKEGLDKNMHKALKVQDHPDITFRLTRLEPGAAGALRAVGLLRVAGAEREIAVDLTTSIKDSLMTVRGRVDLLMPDFGIAPPKAMLGMLKTDPKVTVTFETVLASPLT